MEMFHLMVIRSLIWHSPLRGLMLCHSSKTWDGSGCLWSSPLILRLASPILCLFSSTLTCMHRSRTSRRQSSGIPMGLLYSLITTTLFNYRLKRNTLEELISLSPPKSASPITPRFCDNSPLLALLHSIPHKYQRSQSLCTQRKKRLSRYGS